MNTTPKRGRGRPKKPTGQGIQMRIDADVVTMGRLLASRAGVTPTEYLSGLLRPLLDRETRKLAVELTRTTAPE